MSKVNSNALKDVSNSSCHADNRGGSVGIENIKPKRSTMPAKKPLLSLLYAANPTLLPSQAVTKPSENEVDIDSDDKDVPEMAVDYVKGLYRYHRSVELPIPNYMPSQTKISEQARAVVVGWITKETENAKLNPETLYLIVNVIDRFLAKRKVAWGDLQLLAITALLIGSKYEETWHFTTWELINLCDKTYDEDEILGMEIEILKTLDYRLSLPSAYTFLVRFLKASKKDVPHGTDTLSKYILDVTLLCYNMCHTYLPSELAAMAVFLARKHVQLDHTSTIVWSQTLQYHTDYSEKKMEEVASDFFQEKMKIPKPALTGLNKKYHLALMDAKLNRTYLSLKF